MQKIVELLVLILNKGLGSNSGLRRFGYGIRGLYLLEKIWLNLTPLTAILGVRNTGTHRFQDYVCYTFKFILKMPTQLTECVQSNMLDCDMMDLYFFETYPQNQSNHKQVQMIQFYYQTYLLGEICRLRLARPDQMEFPTFI